MTQFAAEDLLDPPAYPDVGYALLADRIGAVMRSFDDVVFVQAEAVVALEAVAASLAKPGLKVLNVVTSMYGDYFATWLRRGGAVVENVVAEPGRPVDLAVFQAALDAMAEVDVVVLVHGEAANGVLNPLPEIAESAKARGALLVVDAVASIGAHQFEVQTLGIDIAVIGPQKGLGGPAGLSAISVSEAAWAKIAEEPALRLSTLSLLDLKEKWLDLGADALPGTPAPLEFWALDAALDRIDAEEDAIETVIERHQLAARATRAGLRALGVPPWIEDDGSASALVTAAPVPAGVEPQALVDASGGFEGAAISLGVGGVEHLLVRLNHTGIRAAYRPVLANVVAYGQALAALGQSVDIDAAIEAVARAYQDAEPVGSAE
ncbi:aminotransferase class V-fold PLP-dependent enzyme [Kaistia defluvii]|uniref:pyridoxal-phosphate-dependent aminotransferase family protein n=1 Tax=Kaistia defluvii TaxID=410841 RepID=UPI00225475D4|nr:aminotransferase class V-fold PLP-dependent enzyme [Kaistia defluvii]MCX5517309.1 aminotransferase class V-fold PLP-dependent enzyme [Kaistia defluvii]